MTNQPIVQTQKLVKTYGKKANKFDALRGINLTINKGESIAITGKSGSGKSTLMHLLALLDSPTSGNILINGKNTNNLKTREVNRLRNKSFGFVFQSFYLNGNSNVLSNVVAPLVVAGVPKKKRNKIALAAIKSVGLKDKTYAKAKDLSGGQKQRACIARAIVNRPAVIFADEPTGNLDSKTGEQVKNLLFNLNKRYGITLVIVTHDPDLASNCSRQVHISDGELIKETR